MVVMDEDELLNGGEAGAVMGGRQGDKGGVERREEDKMVKDKVAEAWEGSERRDGGGKATKRKRV